MFKSRKSKGFFFMLLLFIGGVFLAPKVKPHLDKLMGKPQDPA